MKKVVCIDDADAEGITINKCYEGIEEDSAIRLRNDFGKMAWYVADRFKEVPNKIKLLLQDGEIVYNNRIYKVFKSNENSQLTILTTDRYLECEIRWGKDYNTTLADVKPLLDALNIEIVEPAPLYKIDVEGEYTAEQVAELEKIGIKFKKECV